jgi:hypothetical protein
MNNYITLDGKKYSCPYKQWEMQTEKPMSYRYTWGSGIETTYGAGVFKTWKGNMVARITPASGFGSVADIRITLAKTVSLTFIDHYGTTFTVHASYAGPERSFSPVWDGASNAIFFPVLIVSEA